MTTGMHNLNLAYLRAVERGDVQQAQNMLELGADLEATSESHRNALHLAAAKGHLAMAKFLLNAGINVDAEDDECDRPMHRAASCNQPRMLHLLAVEEGTITAKNFMGQLPIWETLFQRKIDAFSTLLDLGAMEDEYWNKEYSHTRNRARESDMVDFRVLLNEYDAVTDRIAELDSGTALKAYLLSPEKSGRKPMQCAAAWQHLPEIFTKLESEGLTLSKDELTAPLIGGDNLLSRAVECHQFGAVMAYLEGNGEQLSAADFVNPETKEATPLLEKVVETCQLGLVLDMIRQSVVSQEVLRAVIRAVPADELQWQVPNLHVIRSELGREKNALGR